MKYLLFLLILLSCCSKIREEYPGKKYITTCLMYWELDYKIDIKKCENHITNPKFTKGTVIKLDIPDNCKTKILSISYYANNEKAYTHVTKCEDPIDQKIYGCDGNLIHCKISESLIK
jgi:hypothetical protein